MDESCWQVREILYGNDVDDESLPPQSNHSLFIQLDVLCHFDEDDSIGWKEMARWVQLAEIKARNHEDDDLSAKMQQ